MMALAFALIKQILIINLNYNRACFSNSNILTKLLLQSVSVSVLPSDWCQNDFLNHTQWGRGGGGKFSIAL